MLDKCELTAFVGVIGSGKDYQCQKLRQEGFTQINFADSLRDLAWHIFGWKPKDANEYELFKKKEWILDLPETIDVYSSTDQKTTLEGDIPPHVEMSGRLFLQRLGDGARNIINDLAWVRAFEHKLFTLRDQGHKKFCVSDLRYANEFAAVRNLPKIIPGLQVRVVFTDYRSDRYNATDPHPSEKLAQEFLATGSYKDLDTIYLSPEIRLKEK